MLVLLAATCCAGGCATKNVQIASEFPAPVVEPLPLKVGLYYNEDLLKYVHREQKPGGADWVIELGPGHEPLFDLLFRSLFRAVTRTGNPARPAGKSLAFDLIIEPTIQGYTLETPMESGIDFYQVSILYSLNFYSPKGELLTLWPVDAYGRSRSGWRVATQPVSKATVLAMRDAAAQIALKVAEDPDFFQQLQTGQVKPSIEAGSYDP